MPATSSPATTTGNAQALRGGADLRLVRRRVDAPPRGSRRPRLASASPMPSPAPAARPAKAAPRSPRRAAATGRPASAAERALLARRGPAARSPAPGRARRARRPLEPAGRCVPSGLAAPRAGARRRCACGGAPLAQRWSPPSSIQIAVAERRGRRTVCVDAARATRPSAFTMRSLRPRPKSSSFECCERKPEPTCTILVRAEPVGLDGHPRARPRRGCSCVRAGGRRARRARRRSRCGTAGAAATSAAPSATRSGSPSWS